MRKAGLVVTILCGVASSAAAGERPGSRPKAVLLPRVADGAAHVPDAPGHSDRSGEQRFMLPAGGARLQSLPARTVLTQVTRESAADAAAPAWRAESAPSEITARAGGSYAVYDVINAQPKPRHRKSPLSAAFVLRLDGTDDSPPFSIGGGGVAAAVWRAVPR